MTILVTPGLVVERCLFIKTSYPAIIVHEVAHMTSSLLPWFAYLWKSGRMSSYLKT